MFTLKIIHRAAVLFLLIMLVSPAIADVEIIEAQSVLEHWALYGNSHGACAGASWNYETTDGPSFDVQTTGYDGSCVTSSWVGHADADGLFFSGSVSPVTVGPQGWWINLSLEMNILLELTTPMRVTASRTVEGTLSPALHTVSLALPNGTQDVLLGSDGETHHVERTLAAGTYLVTLSIETNELWDVPFEYSGLIEVRWNSTVASEMQTWSGVKTLYHSR